MLDALAQTLNQIAPPFHPQHCYREELKLTLADLVNAKSRYRRQYGRGPELHALAHALGKVAALCSHAGDGAEMHERMGWSWCRTMQVASE